MQELLEEGIRTPVRAEPHIGLEEIDADEVVMRIAATPASEADGPRLADEILAAIAPVTRDVEDAREPRIDDPRRDPAGPSRRSTSRRGDGGAALAASSAHSFASVPAA